MQVNDCILFLSYYFWRILFIEFSYSFLLLLNSILGLDFAFACKSRLQNYAQKKKCGLPFYSTVQESSSTPPRFKATVTVQGKSYEGQIFANSIKAAENEAAKYALSFFPELPNEDVTFSFQVIRIRFTI